MALRCERRSHRGHALDDKKMQVQAANLKRVVASTYRRGDFARDVSPRNTLMGTARYRNTAKRYRL